MVRVRNNSWTLAIASIAVLLVFTGCSLVLGPEVPGSPSDGGDVDTNLLVNPYFEGEPEDEIAQNKAPEGWQRASGKVGTHMFFEAVTDPFQEGRWVRFFRTSTDDALITLRSVSFDVVPGTTYHASVMAKGDSGAGARFGIEFQVDGSWSEGPRAIVDGNDWNNLALEAEVPENATGMRLTLRIPSTGVGEVYFYGPSLYEGGFPDSPSS